MDALLIVVTVLSLLVALGMSVVAWRATNDERRRAAARVAALAAAAQVAPASEAAEAAPVDDAPAATRPWRPAPTDGRPQTLATESPVAPIAVNAGFLGAEAPARAEGAAPQRALVAAAAVLAVLLGGFAVARVGSGTSSAGVPAAPLPLELLSLRHEREGSMLSVTGLVRNPASAESIERVSAVVLLFDTQGAFVTSATAPIDFVRLAGGEESPFVVRMQAPASVARYRVSFRTADGAVTHVDRRNDESSSPVALTRQ